MYRAGGRSSDIPCGISFSFTIALFRLPRCATRTYKTFLDFQSLSRPRLILKPLVHTRPRTVPSLVRHERSQDGGHAAAKHSERPPATSTDQPSEIRSRRRGRTLVAVRHVLPAGHGSCVHRLVGQLAVRASVPLAVLPLFGLLNRDVESDAQTSPACSAPALGPRHIFRTPRQCSAIPLGVWLRLSHWASWLRFTERVDTIGRELTTQRLRVLQQYRQFTQHQS